jgi:hypothetical protein
MDTAEDRNPTTKKVSHPIWPVLPLTLVRFVSTVILEKAIEYEYRVYSLQSEN